MAELLNWSAASAVYKRLILLRLFKDGFVFVFGCLFNVVVIICLRTIVL